MINNLRDHAALFITNDIKRKSHYANIELIYLFHLATPTGSLSCNKFVLWLYRIYSLNVLKLN